MIVTIAGWLFIIQASLALVSVFGGYGGRYQGAYSIIIAGVTAAMGLGLLTRQAWGRWLALGSSLLTWAIGVGTLLIGLGVLAFNGKLGQFFLLMFSKSEYAIVAVIVFVICAILLAVVVVNYKLFHYLRSEPGCEEFRVPHGSISTIAISAAFWVVLASLPSVMYRNAVMSSLAREMMGRDRSQKSSYDPVQAQLESERRHQRYIADQRQRSAAQAERLRAIRESQDRQAIDSVTADAVHVPQPASEPAMADEARAPTLAAGDDEKPDATRILKCRDASGAVTFTQGYCPSGTQRVDMPQRE